METSHVESAGQAERALIALLQLAHSGELAASLAYDGHWRSVSDPAEKREIQKIEQEELDHRADVRKMLDGLGASPDLARERKMKLIGRTIGLLCRIGGWFIPMYGAGRLESGNVGEYEQAARLAARAGHHHYVERLLVMAEVEWDHERYFRDKVEGHWLSRVVPVWKALAPREEIRRSYGEFARDPVDGDISSRARLPTSA